MSDHLRENRSVAFTHAALAEAEDRTVVYKRTMFRFERVRIGGRRVTTRRDSAMQKRRIFVQVVFCVSTYELVFVEDALDDDDRRAV